MKRNGQENAPGIDGRQIGYEDVDQHRPSDITSDFLWVVIPFTTPELTRVALRHAMCSALDVHVSLFDIQVVPFPCPLDQPPIDREHSLRQLLELLNEAGLRGEIAVVYARDWLEGFRKVLDPKSLVIVATQGHWWPTREKRLLRALQKAGHQVMLLPVR